METNINQQSKAVAVWLQQLLQYESTAVAIIAILTSCIFRFFLSYFSTFPTKTTLKIYRYFFLILYIISMEFSRISLLLYFLHFSLNQVTALFAAYILVQSIIRILPLVCLVHLFIHSFAHLVCLSVYPSVCHLFIHSLFKYKSEMNEVFLLFMFLVLLGCFSHHH